MTKRTQALLTAILTPGTFQGESDPITGIWSFNKDHLLCTNRTPPKPGLLSGVGVRGSRVPMERKGQGSVVSHLRTSLHPSSCPKSCFLAVSSSLARLHPTASTTSSFKQDSTASELEQNTLVCPVGSWLTLGHKARALKGEIFLLNQLHDDKVNECHQVYLKVCPMEVITCGTDSKYIKNWPHTRWHTRTHALKCSKGVTSPNETSHSLLLRNCNEA